MNNATPEQLIGFLVLFLAFGYFVGALKEFVIILFVWPPIMVAALFIWMNIGWIGIIGAAVAILIFLVSPIGHAIIFFCDGELAILRLKSEANSLDKQGEYLAAKEKRRTASMMEEGRWNSP